MAGLEAAELVEKYATVYYGEEDIIRLEEGDDEKRVVLSKRVVHPSKPDINENQPSHEHQVNEPVTECATSLEEEGKALGEYHCLGPEDGREAGVRYRLYGRSPVMVGL